MKKVNLSLAFNVIALSFVMLVGFAGARGGGIPEWPNHGGPDVTWVSGHEIDGAWSTTSAGTGLSYLEQNVWNYYGDYSYRYLTMMRYEVIGTPHYLTTVNTYWALNYYGANKHQATVVISSNEPLVMNGLFGVGLTGSLGLSTVASIQIITIQINGAPPVSIINVGSEFDDPIGQSGRGLDLTISGNPSKPNWSYVIVLRFNTNCYARAMVFWAANYNVETIYQWYWLWGTTYQSWDSALPYYYSTVKTEAGRMGSLSPSGASHWLPGR